MIHKIKRKKRRILFRFGAFLLTIGILLVLHQTLGDYVTNTATMVATLMHLSGFADELIRG